jgi:hypothetical protein
LKTGLVIVISLVAGLISGWFVGERYTISQTRQKFTETGTTFPILDPKDFQKDVDAKKQYLKENIHIKIGLADHETGAFWYLKGNVENTGNRDIDRAHLTIHFLDNSGKICGEDANNDGNLHVKAKANQDFSFLVSPPECWAQKAGSLDYQVTDLVFAK